MIHLVEEVGSTNDAMAARAAAGAAEGEWLVALRQTGGRGRSGRLWSAPDGNLSASGLVRLRSSDPPAPTLALLVGLAAWDSAAAWLAGRATPMLKWPNDLLVQGAKISGMLLERHGDAVVVGVGMNLAAAPDLPDRAVTSLAALGAAVPTPTAAAEILAGHFADWLAVWRAQGLAPVRAAWSARAHAPGTPLRVRLGTEVVDGNFNGLDEGGALRLRHAGRVRTVSAGDVFLL